MGCLRVARRRLAGDNRRAGWLVGGTGRRLALRRSWLLRARCWFGELGMGRLVGDGNYHCLDELWSSWFWQRFLGGELCGDLGLGVYSRMSVASRELRN